jgi:glycosyltransferase involved in cell wall biosynthesis
LITAEPAELGTTERPSPPELSVVVCCHNGADALPTALTSLGRQTAEPDRYEVVVVDDGSSDATAAVAAEMGARVVRLEVNAGLAAARNAGVSAARGEIVAFTDDDCETETTWVAALLRRFTDPAVEAVGGKAVPGPGVDFATRFLRARNPLRPLSQDLLVSRRLSYRLFVYLRATLLGPPALTAGDRLYSVVGANMAFRRSLIFRLGGFDEAFRFGGEEEDLCRRAHDLPGGTRIVYEPAAGVIHHFAPGLRDTLRRARAYGRGNAREMLKRQEMRPIVYPFPMLTAVGVSLGLLTRRRAIVMAAAMIPLIGYPRWLVDAYRQRSLEPLAYPYVQTVQETQTMRGEIDGLRAGYAPVPAEHLALAP